MNDRKAYLVVIENNIETKIELANFQIEVKNGFDINEGTFDRAMSPNGRKRITLTAETNPGMPLSTVKTLFGTRLED